MSYYKITDKNGTTYNFPGDFELDGGNVENNTNMLNTAYAAGGRDIADKFLRPRRISISGPIRADSGAAFEALKNAIILAALKGGDFRYHSDIVSRYIAVKFLSVDLTAPQATDGGPYRYQEITISFECESPFWKDDTETDDNNTVTGDDTLTISTTGTVYLLKPIITIDADQGVDVPSVVLINNSDGGMRLDYNDSIFSAGDSVVIDCAEGTVKRNGNDTIEYFSGAFLRLQPGSNTIEYEGAACTITFSFKKVYL